MFKWGIEQQIIASVCILVLAALWGAVGFVRRGVEEERRQFEHGQDYDPRHVRLANVHTRQDIVLVCYLLNWVVGLLIASTALIAAHVLHHW